MYFDAGEIQALGNVSQSVNSANGGDMFISSGIGFGTDVASSLAVGAATSTAIATSAIAAGLPLAILAGVDLLKCGTITQVGCEKIGETKAWELGLWLSVEILWSVENGSMNPQQAMVAVQNVSQGVRGKLRPDSFTRPAHIWFGDGWVNGQIPQGSEGYTPTPNQSQMVPTTSFTGVWFTNIQGQYISPSNWFGSTIPGAIQQLLQAKGIRINPNPPTIVGHITGVSSVTPVIPSNFSGSNTGVVKTSQPSIGQTPMGSNWYIPAGILGGLFVAGPIGALVGGGLGFVMSKH